MALKNADGHYTKITRVDTERSRIYIETFSSATARNAKLNEFQQSKVDSIHCGKLAEAMAKSANSHKTIENNLISAGYVALKNEPDYRDMTDC